MLDFGALPPEINSGRMYAGPGSGPLLAAAAAWDALAAELYSAAASYGSTIEGLTVAPWMGPSSITMAAAVAPYVAWISVTAGQAEQAGAQAKIAAGVYETAFAATVPPPVIEANRANPSATAAQSAVVAQAAGAAASSDITAQLSQLISLLPSTLQSLATTATATSASAGWDTVLQSITTILANLTGPYSIIGLGAIPGGWWLTFGQILGLAQNAPGVAALLGPKAAAGALSPLAPLRGGYIGDITPLGGGATGGIARAIYVGSLSVPQGWAEAAPVMRAVASVLPGTGAAPALAAEAPGALFGEMALSSLAGRALAGTAVRSGAGAARVAGGSVTEDVASTTTIIVIPAD